MSEDIRAAVKRRMRFNHDELNSDIDDLINAAKADMVRAGVDADIVQECGSLVKQAAITFCQKELTEEKDLIDKFEEAYKIQLDNIRKSGDLARDVSESEKSEEG